MKLSRGNRLAVFIAALSWSATTSASGLASGGAPEVPWLRIFLSLAFCLGLAATAILALKHFRSGNSSGISKLLSSDNKRSRAQISVIETRRIAQSASICLVEFDGRQLLLGVSPQRISILTERSAMDHPEQSSGADE